MTSSAKFLLASGLTLTQGFYLPGVAPREFEKGDNINVKVNKLFSMKTQVPYQYYTLPYCEPDTIMYKQQNLGEILRGDEITNSPYKVKMQDNITCEKMCEVELDDEQMKTYKEMIENEYFTNLLVDNIPAFTEFSSADLGQTFNNVGFPIGFQHEGNIYVQNHLHLIFYYHYPEGQGYQNGYIDRDETGARIVGFQVQPYSLARTDAGDCSGQGGMKINEDRKITFTYGVEFRESPVRWASRWDMYLNHSSPTRIHWFAIVNSFVLVCLLSAMAGSFLMRVIHKDLTRYAEDEDDDSGWKVVHGDVFRGPKGSRILSIFLGTGAHLLCVSCIVLVFACLGFLSPANRGSLIQASLFLFAFCACICGFTAVRFDMFFGCQYWKVTAFLAIAFLPACIFGMTFLLNLLVWSNGSVLALPFGTMCVLVLMWCGISFPLGMMGAKAAQRMEPFDIPVKVNQIARQIPKAPWYHKSPLICIFLGIGPFGTIFTEIYFIMDSIWGMRFYYLFGFLALALVLLCAVSALTSIVTTYALLSSEDHTWWWRAFLAPAGAGIHLFFYSILFFATKIGITHIVGVCLYYGYMFMVSMMVFMLCGYVGTVASFHFARKIYGSIKVD